MIEAPEARILCRQLNETVRGKKITDVYTQFSPHKFAWFTGSSEEYAEQLSGKTIDHAQSQGGIFSGIWRSEKCQDHRLYIQWLL